MRKILMKLYLLFLVFISIYQDLPLVNYFGEIARSPVVFMLPIFILLEFYLLMKDREIKVSRLDRLLTFFTIYIIFVSFSYVFYNFLMSNYEVLEENLLLKSLKGFTYFVVIILYLRHIKFILKYFKLKDLIPILIIVNLIIFFILILEYLLLPNSFLFLHSSDIPYYRIRLLTVESSWVSTIIIIFSGLLIFLSRYAEYVHVKIICILISCTSFMTYAFLSGSKGFLITLLIVPIFIYINSLNLNSYKKVLFNIILPFVIVFIFTLFSDQLINSINNDINNYTSVATRLSTVIGSIIVVMQHPFGVGTGAYLEYLPKGITMSIEFIENNKNIFIKDLNLNYTEVLNYMKEAENLSAKSGFFQWFLLGGIGALIFFFIFFKDLYVWIRGYKILLLILITITLSVVGYISIDIKYEIWFFVAFIERYFSGRNNSEVHQ